MQSRRRRRDRLRDKSIPKSLAAALQTAPASKSIRPARHDPLFSAESRLGIANPAPMTMRLNRGKMAANRRFPWAQAHACGPLAGSVILGITEFDFISAGLRDTLPLRG